MEQKDWFKDRGYPHFSNKTPLSTRKDIESYISNPDNIAKHSFYPLIFKEISQRRYKLSDFDGVERRSHKKMKDGEVISNKKSGKYFMLHILMHIYTLFIPNLYQLSMKNI